MRWRLELQDYNYTFEHVAGVDNIVADALSRLVGVEPDLSVSNPTAQPIVEHLAGGLKEQFTIPTDKWEMIIRAHSALAGHYGVDETTLRKLDLLNLKWRGRREHVKEFLRQCPICQKQSERNHHIYTEPYTLSTHRPMQRINIDTIGPFEPDDKGNKFILAVIDNFSRYLTLYPIPDTKGKDAARVLLCHIAMFGAPSQVTSDQGSQFLNYMVDE
eukprot:gene17770-24783_t